MAELDVAAGALGSRVSGHLRAVPPTGWLGVVVVAVLAVLAWHVWDRDDDDSTSWTDPQQPPTNVEEPMGRIAVPTNTQMQPSWDTNAMRGRRAGATAPGAY